MINKALKKFIRLDNFNKKNIFFVKSYSLIQLGSYFISFISYIFYLLPILNNDLLIYSYLISTITNLRFRIYLNDIIEYFLSVQTKFYNNIFIKKVILYFLICIINLLIYLFIAKLNIAISFFLTFGSLIGIYIENLNNFKLHYLIRKNLISKRKLFLFGFLPRLTSTLLLVFYILLFKSSSTDSNINSIKYVIFFGMYILPSLIYRIIFFNNLSLKKLFRKQKYSYLIILSCQE